MEAEQQRAQCRNEQDVHKVPCEVAEPRPGVHGVLRDSQQARSGCRSYAGVDAAVYACQAHLRGTAIVPVCSRAGAYTCLALYTGSSPGMGHVKSPERTDGACLGQEDACWQRWLRELEGAWTSVHMCPGSALRGGRPAMSKHPEGCAASHFRYSLPLGYQFSLIYHKQHRIPRAAAAAASHHASSAHRRFAQPRETLHAESSRVPPTERPP